MRRTALSQNEFYQHLIGLPNEEAEPIALSELKAAKESNNPFWGLKMAGFLLSSESENTRESIAEELVWLYLSDVTPKDAVLETFEVLLHDSSAEVRVCAAYALRGIVQQVNPNLLKLGPAAQVYDGFSILKSEAHKPQKLHDDFWEYVYNIADKYLNDDDFRISQTGLLLAQSVIDLPDKIVPVMARKAFSDGLLHGALNHKHDNTRLNAAQRVLYGYYHSHYGQGPVQSDLARKHIVHFIASGQSDWVRRGMIDNVFGVMNGGGYVAADPDWCIDLARVMYEKGHPLFSDVISAFPNIQKHDQSGKLVDLIHDIVLNQDEDTALEICNVMYGNGGFEQEDPETYLKIYRLLKSHGSDAVQERLSPYSFLTLKLGAAKLRERAKADLQAAQRNEDRIVTLAIDAGLDLDQGARYKAMLEDPTVAEQFRNDFVNNHLRSHSYNFLSQEGSYRDGEGFKVTSVFFATQLCDAVDVLSGSPAELEKFLHGVIGNHQAPDDVKSLAMDVLDDCMDEIRDRAFKASMTEPSVNYAALLPPTSDIEIGAFRKG